MTAEGGSKHSRNAAKPWHLCLEALADVEALIVAVRRDNRRRIARSLVRVELLPLLLTGWVVVAWKAADGLLEPLIGYFFGGILAYGLLGIAAVGFGYDFIRPTAELRRVMDLRLFDLNKLLSTVFPGPTADHSVAFTRLRPTERELKTLRRRLNAALSVGTRAAHQRRPKPHHNPGEPESRQ